MRFHRIYRALPLHVETLEGRRLLCGAGHPDATDADPAGPAAAGAAVLAAPAADAGKGIPAGHVVSAFARGRGMHGGKLVWGESAVIDGQTVVTWAVVAKKGGRVIAAGATVPIGLSEDQPQERGAGPAGAIASLDFPAVVQQTTFFNHLELHTNPNGHPISPAAVNPNRYRVPHFDFHFYAIPEAQVRSIPFAPPIVPVPADRLPAGYGQPGPSELEMGRHSGPLSELSEPDTFDKVMIAGFTPQADRMHFIEPMITTETLLERQDIDLDVPMPAAFDFDALYPTRFEAVYHAGAHHFIFSDFIDTNPATPVGAAPAAPAAAPARLFAGGDDAPGDRGAGLGDAADVLG